MHVVRDVLLMDKCTVVVMTTSPWDYANMSIRPMHTGFTITCMNDVYYSINSWVKFAFRWMDHPKSL